METLLASLTVLGAGAVLVVAVCKLGEARRRLAFMQALRQRDAQRQR